MFINFEHNNLGNLCRYYYVAGSRTIISRSLFKVLADITGSLTIEKKHGIISEKLTIGSNIFFKIININKK